MPSPSSPPHLCVFGDSHFACVKAALKAGLVDPGDTKIEFWGNTGHRFKYLGWRDGQITPLDEFTAHRFAKFNEQGRRSLAAEDFDMILFVGCRIMIYRIFPELLHRRRTPGMHISLGAERRILADFVRAFVPYQFARNMAAQGKARVVVSPVSFDILGFSDTISPVHAAAADATAEDRAGVWDSIESVMAEDRISLIRQDEATVVGGCCSDPAYATDRYVERRDYTHKNAAFGAIQLKQALAVLHLSVVTCAADDAMP